MSSKDDQLPPLQRRRIVIGITGASGACYGVRALELLQQQPDVETHLIVSRGGIITLKHECGLTLKQVQDMADVSYRSSDIGAAIASGSFAVDAMVVMPCSVKTLSGIAYGYADDLIVRAADVCLKEGRPLLLLVRETPLHNGHLTTLIRASDAGAIIAPPVPAFYAHPQTIDDIIDHTVRRSLSRVGLRELRPAEWSGDLASLPSEDRP